MATANFLRIFGMPALLAIVSAIGLLSALLGDGVWDWLSWLALGAPVAVIAWHVAPARSTMSLYLKASHSASRPDSPPHDYPTRGDECPKHGTARSPR